MSSLDLSIRLGELGRPRRVSIRGGWVMVFWTSCILLVLGFLLISWQVVSAARIYPELLYQNRRTSSLAGKMNRLRQETTLLRTESADMDSLTARLGGRFGIDSTRWSRTEGLPSGQKLIETLFPDPSGSEIWSREAADLGERTSRLRQELSTVAKVAKAKIDQLEQTPSIAPARGQLSSGFGWRLHPVFGEYLMHEGQDITSSIGTPVTATALGKVVVKEYSSSYGNYVVVAHGNGVRTLYAHLNAFKCELGENVRRGQVIGLLGNTGRSTGPHVHYEVRLGERPVDPMPWILPTTLVP
jgi:murein DD-endopeptidase MepM/ murein hydrolase activator NlpD